ncbi:MAG: hypothetical protein JO182_18490 [Acidobacteriaceae bacterium]|nr:hypothetical protein [Acidobacteriaceae bacterium]
MIEHVREEQLALYAWGDLPPQESSAVTTHLADCDQCQKVLAELHQARNFVTTSLQNPGEGEVSEVRRRLTTKLQPQRSVERHLAWWGAGVAAALALLILPRNFEKRSVVVQQAAPTIATFVLPEMLYPGPAIKLPITPVSAPHQRHLRSQEAGIRTVTLIAQADQEPIIKMTTADPNVVILWQSNNRTEH